MSSNTNRALVREAIVEIFKRRPDLRHRAKYLRLFWGPSCDAEFLDKGILACTNGYEVAITSAWFGHLSSEQRAAVLAHEFLHADMSHPFRSGEAKRTKRAGWCDQCGQIAADWIVNDALADKGSPPFSRDLLKGISGSQLPIDEEDEKQLDKSSLVDLTSFIHAKYHGGQEQEQEKENGREEGKDPSEEGEGDPAQGECSGGQPPENASMPDVVYGQEGNEAMDRATGRLMRSGKAATDSEGNHVTGSGASTMSVNQVLMELDIHFSEPERFEIVAEAVARWVADKVSKNAALLTNRPSRRIAGTPNLDILWPFCNRKTPKVVLAVDLSGSITGSQAARVSIVELAMAIQAALERAHGCETANIVWGTNAETQPPELLDIGGWPGLKTLTPLEQSKRWTNLAQRTGGGTTVGCALDAAAKVEDMTALVIISDGEFSGGDYPRLRAGCLRKTHGAIPLEPEDILMVFGGDSSSEQAELVRRNTENSMTVIDQAW